MNKIQAFTEAFGWVSPQNKLYKINDMDYAPHEEFMKGNIELFGGDSTMTIGDALRNGWTRFMAYNGVLYAEYNTNNPMFDKQLMRVAETLKVAGDSKATLENQKGSIDFNTLAEMWDFVWSGKKPRVIATKSKIKEEIFNGEADLYNLIKRKLVKIDWNGSFKTYVNHLKDMYRQCDKKGDVKLWNTMDLKRQELHTNMLVDFLELNNLADIPFIAERGVRKWLHEIASEMI